MPKLGNYHNDDSDLTEAQSLNKAKKRVIEKMKGSLVETSLQVDDKNVEDGILKVNKLLEDQIYILDNMEGLINSKGSIAGRPAGLKIRKTYEPPITSESNTLNNILNPNLLSPLLEKDTTVSKEDIELSDEDRINILRTIETRTYELINESIDETKTKELEQIDKIKSEELEKLTKELETTKQTKLKELDDKITNLDKELEVLGKIEEEYKKNELELEKINAEYDKAKKQLDTYDEELKTGKRKREGSNRKKLSDKVNELSTLISNKEDLLDKLEEEANKEQVRHNKINEELAKLQKTRKELSDEEDTITYNILKEEGNKYDDEIDKMREKIEQDITNLGDETVEKIKTLNNRKLLDLYKKIDGFDLNNLLEYLNILTNLDFKISVFSEKKKDEGDFEKDFNELLYIKQRHDDNLQDIKYAEEQYKNGEIEASELERLLNLDVDITRELSNAFDKLLINYPTKKNELYKYLTDINKNTQTKPNLEQEIEDLPNRFPLEENPIDVEPSLEGEGKYKRRRGGATGTRFYKEGSYIDYLTYLNKLISNQKTINNLLFKYLPSIKYVSMDVVNTLKELTNTYIEKIETTSGEILKEVKDANGNIINYDVLINPSNMKNLDLPLIKNRWIELFTLSDKTYMYYIDAIQNYNEARTRKQKPSLLTINKKGSGKYYIGDDIPTRYL